jgi:hypothetical protein
MWNKNFGFVNLSGSAFSNITDACIDETVHLQLQYRRQSCRPSVLVLTILTNSTYKCMTLPAITWHCYSQLLPRFLEMVGTMMPRNFINQFLYVDSGETVTHVDSIQMSSVRVRDPQYEESLFMTGLRAPTWYKFGAHAHPHQVASSEAQDVLHWVMRPALHHHICILHWFAWNFCCCQFVACT